MAVGSGGQHAVIQHRLFTSLALPIRDKGFVFLLIVKEEIPKCAHFFGGRCGGNGQILLLEQAVILYQCRKLGRNMFSVMRSAIC